MDTASLSDAIYEDLEATLVSIHRRRRDALALTLECDDWEGGASRRRFELVCHDPAEVQCSLGGFESLGCHAEHPVLLEHQGQHSQLFFSSAPASPGEVFLAAHRAINSVLSGWRAPSSVLCHDPGLFGQVMAKGHGLLARGPEPVIAALEVALRDLLRVDSLPSHFCTGQFVALTLGSGWVVSRAVDVTELRD